MAENKVIARFSTEGAVLYPKHVCEENPGKYEHKITVKVEDTVVENGRKTTRTKYLHVPIRNCIPAERVVCVTLDTYREWMQHPPVKEDSKMWKTWGKERKIERHLEEMARTYGERLISFSILPD